MILTVLDAKDHVSKPAPALVVAVGGGLGVQAHLHDDALFAHLHDHVKRVFLRIVEDLNELH
jgi:hypothetical protein